MLTKIDLSETLKKERDEQWWFISSLASFHRKITIKGSLGRALYCTSYLPHDSHYLISKDSVYFVKNRINIFESKEDNNIIRLGKSTILGYYNHP